MVQNNYGFFPAAGIPGGLVDLTNYAIDAFANEENNGVLDLGIGVVGGTAANQIKKPTNASTSAQFLGVTVNGRTNEFDTYGEVSIRKGATVGVLRYGRVYVQVKTGVSPAVGDALYLVKTGTDAGKFTNASGADAVPVAGKFIGTKGTNGVAAVHLYDAPASAVLDSDTVYTLPTAGANTLGGVKVGTGLTIADDGTLSVTG